MQYVKQSVMVNNKIQSTVEYLKRENHNMNEIQNTITEILTGNFKDKNKFNYDSLYRDAQRLTFFLRLINDSDCTKKTNELINNFIDKITE